MMQCKASPIYLLYADYLLDAILSNTHVEKYAWKKYNIIKIIDYLLTD